MAESPEGWVWKDVREGIPFLLKLTWQSSKTGVVARVVGGVLVPVVVLGSTIGYQWLIDAIQGGNPERIRFAAEFFLTVVAVGIIGNGLSSFATDSIRQELDFQIDQHCLERTSSVPSQTLEDPEFRTMLERFRKRSGGLVNVFLWGANLLATLTGCLGYLIIFKYVPWYVFFVMLGFTGMHLVIGKRVAIRQWYYYLRETRDGKQAVNRWTQLIAPNLLWALRGLNAARYIFQEWVQLTQATLALKRKQTADSRWMKLFGRCLNLAGLIFSLWILLRELKTGHLSTGEAVAFVVGIRGLLNQVEECVQIWQSIQQELPILALLGEVDRMPQEPTTESEPLAEDVRIIFDRVSFQYPGQEKAVLSDVSFSLDSAEHIALVGRNGSGKSTLLKLLTGIYAPTKGRILVNGRDLATVAPVNWRDRLSVMPQDVANFEGPIACLIRLGALDRPLDEDRAAWAMHTSGFAEILAKLPKGLETYLGRNYAIPEDEAMELSGGESQLLALARTLYRKASWYCLDEPTSKIDAERQDAFFSRIFGSLEGRGLVFVSHTFMNVHRAPRVLVLKEGYLVEDGDPKSLVQNEQGEYATLFRSQKL